jgi:hypothetical protein
MRWRLGKNGIGAWAVHHPRHGLWLFTSWAEARDWMRARCTQEPTA